MEKIRYAIKTKNNFKAFMTLEELKKELERTLVEGKEIEVVYDFKTAKKMSYQWENGKIILN